MSKIETYQTADYVFLVEALRRDIKKRVIDIGVTEAHSLVRRRKRNMAGRRLSSIYSKKDAGPAISMKELIATSAALEQDPLETLFDAIKARLGRREVRKQRSYTEALRRIKAQAQQPKRRRETVAGAPPLLEIMGAL